MAQLTIKQAFDLALRHHQAGRLPEAEQLYRQILARQPAHAGALHNLGMIAHRMGRNDIAVDLIRRSIALGSKHVEAHFNLGNALSDMGQHDEAIAAYRQAIAVKPNYPEAHNNLGSALNKKGQLDEAIAAYRQAIALNPKLAEAHNNLGVVRYKGQLDEAIASYRRAIALSPNFAEAHNNLGTGLQEKGQLDEAVAAYRQAIAHKPNYAEGHSNLAKALLLRGDFEEGWPEYEWRWKVQDFPSPRRGFSQPLWDGGELTGRAILLHAEQGLGDTIQFIRYLPRVVQRGGKIILACQAELQRLFHAMAGEYQIVAFGQPLPAFDLHCPLPSLPHVLGTTLGDIPQTVPYLSPEPALVEAWSRTLGAGDGQLRVGLAWAGNPQFESDRTRSLNLQQLAPLAAAAEAKPTATEAKPTATEAKPTATEEKPTVRGVRFYSLQKGAAGAQAKNPPAGLDLVDLGPKLNDFADTAAVMSLMDLIITTDTSVPHLAGALARPVWVMLQFVPDFRWLMDREDSPWYPSMRLFRQRSPGDWDSVIARVVNSLRSLANEQSALDSGR
ncbi:MAG: tetratricopeptide repeat-containing glycosyltransferase family protein [Tepidisphaeraceae bacterium]|jgi:Flp pilus assembly protein TadD